jgi:hypothetical protein
MGRACSTHGGKRDVCGVLMGEPKGKNPLVKPRRRWEDNIKMILEKQDGVLWTGFIWLRTGTSGGLL